ncbi:Homoprotocatechuate catabolism bifunctional isomerase/decarboxylase [Serratia fonticola]|uniref:Homoprotocatechuate catabolism bifunctional isomerase/decarboxylase n=1 Tax=Serratia fonticola TaxID=47917 RepID=A0A4V6KM20_SERFO|nr:Homoprotocatechuate catabolism bifunctional isomerase/decarboxylase [Serratia fonticola]
MIGSIARKVAADKVADYVAGYALANDISLPETSFYRPAIKAKCRDGFCPLGEVAPLASTSNLEIITEINGVEQDRWSTADLVRSVPELTRRHQRLYYPATGGCGADWHATPAG